MSSLTAHEGSRLAAERGATPDGAGREGTVVEQSAQEIARLGERDQEAKSRGHVTADAISTVAGSIPFAVANALFFALWISANTGIAGLPAFDPYPFGALTVVVSLEAIFLSVFVLISQNRQAAASDKRSIVDMQMNTIAEREVTKVLELLREVASKLGVENAGDGELAHMLERTDIDALADAADQVQASTAVSGSAPTKHSQEPAA